MSTLVPHSRAYLILRAVLMALLVFAYWLLASTAISFADVRRSGPGVDSPIFTVYTLLSFCLPLALGLFLALARTRFPVAPRTWLVIALVAVANWLPLLYVVTRGIRLSCDGECR